jgi:hypothetical protein
MPTGKQLEEWHERRRRRPDVNLRHASNQITLAIKKAAVWENKVPEKTLDRLREAARIVFLAADLIEQNWPDPP